MPRYQQGTLEKAIKEIIADFLARTVEDDTNDREEDIDEGIRNRGRVRRPDSDRRLKQNREAA